MHNFKRTLENVTQAYTVGAMTWWRGLSISPQGGAAKHSGGRILYFPRSSLQSSPYALVIHRLWKTRSRSVCLEGNALINHAGKRSTITVQSFPYLAGGSTISPASGYASLFLMTILSNPRFLLLFFFFKNFTDVLYLIWKDARRGANYIWNSVYKCP